MKRFKIIILCLGLCVNATAQTFFSQKYWKSGPVMITAGTFMLGASMIDYNHYGYNGFYIRPGYITTYPRNVFFGVGVGVALTGGVITYRFLR